MSKKTSLYFLLSAFFITNAIIAEFGGAKIFSFEHLFGLPQARFNFLGTLTDINLSVGVLIWPVVFIFSDIINEYFGKIGVRRISFVTAGMIAYAFVIILLWTKMPPADFWMKLNASDPTGNPFDVNYAYSKIFGMGLGIIVGSLSAFLLSQLIDAYVFHYFKGVTGHKYLWFRATGSTIVSQLFDSFIILFIAFYLLGNWSMVQVLQVGLMQYIYKVVLAIVFTPVIYVAHIVIDNYLGKPDSGKLIADADKSW